MQTLVDQGTHFVFDSRCSNKSRIKQMFAAIAGDRPGQPNARPMFFPLICIFVIQRDLCEFYRMCSVLALMHVVVALKAGFGHPGTYPKKPGGFFSGKPTFKNPVKKPGKKIRPKQ